MKNGEIAHDDKFLPCHNVLKSHLLHSPQKVSVWGKGSIEVPVRLSWQSYCPCNFPFIVLLSFSPSFELEGKVRANGPGFESHDERVPTFGFST